MKKHLQISLLLLLLVTVAVAGDQDQAKSSAKAERTVKVRRQAIQTEIRHLGDHPWAGEYYAGDGLGVNTALAIAPHSGYVFEWHGCTGLYDRNYGAVAWTNGRIRLSFTFENQRQGFQGIAPELIPISWGDRRYLIPAEDLVRFCNSVNQGDEPRTDIHGFHFLRRGDESKPVTGFPKMPAEYQSYLLAKPITATIIAVGPSTTRPSAAAWKFKDTPVTIDAGTQQGLRLGMELVVTKPDNVFDSIRITKTQDTRSEAIMSEVGEEYPGPKVGWRLSTQAPWRVQPKK